MVGKPPLPIWAADSATVLSPLSGLIAPFVLKRFQGLAPLATFFRR
jgi:hypothetical protein